MRKKAPFVAMLVIALVGLTRFAREARTVDVVGLFASGALAGLTITRFLVARNK